MALKLLNRNRLRFGIAFFLDDFHLLPIHYNCASTGCGKGAEVQLQPLYGDNAVSRQVSGKTGAISFLLPERNSLKIYKYRIR